MSQQQAKQITSEQLGELLSQILEEVILPQMISLNIDSMKTRHKIEFGKEKGLAVMEIKIT